MIYLLTVALFYIIMLIAVIMIVKKKKLIPVIVIAYIFIPKFVYDSESVMEVLKWEKTTAAITNVLMYHNSGFYGDYVDNVGLLHEDVFLFSFNFEKYNLFKESCEHLIGGKISIAYDPVFSGVHCIPAVVFNFLHSTFICILIIRYVMKLIFRSDRSL